MPRNRTSRLVVILASATVFGSVLAAGSPSPAEAMEPAADRSGISKCDAGRLCLFRGSNFTGDKTTISAVAPGRCRATFYAYRSAINRTGSTQRLWFHGNCSGSNPLVIRSGESLSQTAARLGVSG